MPAGEQIYAEIEKRLRTGFLNQTVLDVVHNLTSEQMSEVGVRGSENEMLCNSYISSIVFMSGPINMALIIAAPKQDVYDAVSKLTGIGAELLSEENLFDLINEIANMVAGRIKALFNQIGCNSTNTYAFTVSGEDYCFFHRSRIKSVNKRYRSSALEINICILFL